MHEIARKIKEMSLWGVDWEVYADTDELDLSPGVHSGCLLEVYKSVSEDIGEIAFIYFDPASMLFTEAFYEILKCEIKSKSLNGCPYVLYEDIKYKRSCQTWNRGHNTVCSVDEFKSKICKSSIERD